MLHCSIKFVSKKKKKINIKLGFLCVSFSVKGSN